jgi:hypothetical protein
MRLHALATETNSYRLVIDRQPRIATLLRRNSTGQASEAVSIGEQIAQARLFC